MPLLSIQRRMQRIPVQAVVLEPCQKIASRPNRSRCGVEPEAFGLEGLSEHFSDCKRECVSKSKHSILLDILLIREHFQNRRQGAAVFY